MIEGREEKDAWGQIFQVYQALDERDARAQDRSMHYELVGGPAGAARGWLFKKVAADAPGPLLYEPLRGSLR